MEKIGQKEKHYHGHQPTGYQGQQQGGVEAAPQAAVAVACHCTVYGQLSHHQGHGGQGCGHAGQEAADKGRQQADEKAGAVAQQEPAQKYGNVHGQEEGATHAEAVEGQGQDEAQGDKERG